MANEIIATVTQVTGTAYARNADGEMRVITAGDALLEGETVVTPNGAHVELALVDGNPFLVQGVEQMVISSDLVASLAPGADESAVEDESVEALLAALEGDQDIGEVLDPTAAGASGGTSGDGHGWVRLGRIVEGTPEFHGLAAFNLSDDTVPDDQADAILPVDAIDDADSTEEGVPVTIDVQQNDDFIEGSTVTQVTQPGNGSVVINPDNTVTYTPNPGFTGVDTFTYTAITPDGDNGDTAIVTVTVTDLPDPPPAVLPTLSIDDVVVFEGDVATVTVTLSQASDEPVSVAFATDDDTATVVGGDYDPESGTITFAPGQTTATIQIQTNADNLEEGTEQLFVNLSDPSGAEIADGQGIVQIIEPDPAPLPSISIDDVTVQEGDTAQLTLSLSAASDEPVTVRFASEDDTATVTGGDYDPDTGTVTFAPGQTEVTITYSTNTDNIEEGIEQFLVNLSDASNATIADDQGIVRIIDGTEVPPPPPPPPPPPEDDEPSLSVTDGEVNEAALATGSNAASNAETTTGTFTITTGVDSLASLMVAGQDVTGGGTVQGQYGTLTVIESGGAYSWSYTLNDSVSHPDAGSTGTAEGMADSFAVTVTDDDGDSADATLTVDILDDGPSASEDVNAATESGPDVTGNVLLNDESGADADATVTGVSGGSVGTALAGSFGTLVLLADGGYTYTPDASVPAGSEDVFTYEITDADGDTASTTLTIVYDGDNSVPRAEDGSAATGDDSLGSDSGSLNFIPGTDTPLTFQANYDGGLGAASQSSTGGVTTLAANDGTWALTIDEATGAYEFNQLAAYTHDQGADSDSATVSITLTDSDGSTADATLTLSIADDGPVAFADGNTATESGPEVNGNVLTNDDPGADGGAAVTGLTGGSVGTALAGTFGTLVLQADGSYAYTPNASVPSGSQDVFTYEITDADGDSASTTLTITFEGDDSVPSAQNGSASTSDAEARDATDSDSGSLNFVPGSDTPVAFEASYDGGLGAASQTSDSGITTFTADDGSWTLTIDEATGDYQFDQLAPYTHDVGADSDGGVVTVTLTDSDGSQASATLNLGITDDEPVGSDVNGAPIAVPVSEQSISGLEAQWTNIQSTGAIAPSEDGDGIYLDWGTPITANGQSGYDFQFAPGTTTSQGITTDSLFSIGTLAHNNFTIQTGSPKLESVDLVVTFDLLVDGELIPDITTTISLQHTETPNDGADPRDILHIAASGATDQTVTVGDRTFILEIEGFLDGSGSLVDTVYTEEGQNNTFSLFARLTSTDDLPNVQGTMDPGDFGADGAAASNALAWDNIDGNGDIEGEYGTLTINGVNPDGTVDYSYVMSREARDAMGEGEVYTEEFTYVLTDEDGDAVPSTFTLTLNGVSNADFVDGVVAGMSYETTSGLTGITTEDGGFNYREGDRVTFSVGGVVIGSIAAEDAVADGKVFLQEIAGTELSDLNNEYVENMAVFLQSLDQDGDAYNGIVISDAAHDAFASSNLDLTTASGAEVQSELQNAGFTPVSEEDAMEHVKDMLTEHAGVTEFDEHVPDVPELLASGGDDVFAFSLSDNAGPGEQTTIIGFGDEGTDVLDLRDLLQGEEAEGADLSSYLNISSEGADTVIQVSAEGAFDGSAADAGHVDQTITLAGVDLVGGHDDLQSVIQNMLDSGKLNVDQ